MRIGWAHIVICGKERLVVPQTTHRFTSTLVCRTVSATWWSITCHMLFDSGCTFTSRHSIQENNRSSNIWSACLSLTMDWLMACPLHCWSFIVLNDRQLGVNARTKCAVSVRLRPLAVFAEQKNVLFAFLKLHKILCLTRFTMHGSKKH